jgi:hypothetical protein
MIDQEDRIDNKVVDMPSQDICDTCKRQEWWHDDEKLKTKTCQRFTTRNARSAGLNRARR